MKNITFAIEEKVLNEVRLLAAKNGTTVNAVVRDYLTALAKQEDRTARARRRIVELARQSTAEVGPITWSRDQLYDR